MKSKMLSRRMALTTLVGFAAGSALARSAPPANGIESIARLERNIGGRIGFAALNTATKRWLSYRARERFAMCSTFKLILAAAILAKVDKATLQLEQPVSFTRDEVLPNSPVGEAHPAGGSEPLKRMLQSMIEASDNTAANRLLAMIGGPARYTDYVRGMGDSTTRLDRMELELNSNQAGDARDTTTPHAMVEDMQRILWGNWLSSNSLELLMLWMRNSNGRNRLRAQLPAGWGAGDKPGTGPHGAVNDLAIFFPPKKPPILVACYMSDSDSPTEVLEAAHGQIGALVALMMG